MADDKNKNEDPEEENNDHFDDDEDFGLPDLEYDELDDDGDEPMDEEPFGDEMEDETPEEVSTPEEPSATPEPVGEEMLDEDISDFDDSETEDWEKELEKELEEELKAEGDDSAGFYEEESFDDFESTSEEIGSDDSDDSEVTASVFGSDDSDDDFDAGIEYADEPAKKETASAYGGGSTPPPTRSYQYDDSASNKGKFVRTVVIGTLVIAVIAFVFLLVWNSKSDEPNKQVAKTEKKAPAKKAPEKKPEEKKPEPKKEEPKPAAKKPEAKPKPQPANTKPAGEITTMSEPTGKTYIVIGSFFDDDLAMDFAQELSADGKSPIIIPPFRDSRFYRVAIAEFNSFKDAQGGLESLKGEYGSDIWPLRY